MSLYLLAEGPLEKPWGGAGQRAVGAGQRGHRGWAGAQECGGPAVLTGPQQSTEALRAPPPPASPPPLRLSAASSANSLPDSAINKAPSPGRPSPRPLPLHPEAQGTGAGEAWGGGLRVWPAPALSGLLAWLPERVSERCLAAKRSSALNPGCTLGSLRCLHDCAQSREPASPAQAWAEMPALQAGSAIA